MIEHLLKIEHWEAASASDLRHWMAEIENWRVWMAATIQDNPGLQGQCGELLRLAWQRGRTFAINALVACGVEREGPAHRKFLGMAWEGQLPQECPWQIEEVVAYNTWPLSRRSRGRGPQPAPDMWPPSVARRLNEELGEPFPEDQSRSKGLGFSG